AGYTGSDSFTYTVSDGKTTSSSTVTLTVQAPPNNAPELKASSATVTSGASVSGSVLATAVDADGDALTASLKAGPAHGTVTVAADGSYKYVAAAGYAGSDSFTYTVSDGKTTSSSTVTLTVEGLAKAPGVLDGAHVVNGSASTNSTYTATAEQDVFYFDLAAKSGSDKVVGFGHGDLLVTSGKIYDGNNDGIIALSGGKVAIDAPKGTDTVTLTGVANLRLLGSDEDGNFVYADASVRPKSALEGTLGADVLKGDAADAKSQVFFFDNDLGLDLGSDKVTSFGARDVIVTTSALKVDGSGHVVVGANGSISLAGSDHAWDQGDLTVTNAKGALVGDLEFDGVVTRDGVSYFVYSMDDSAAGTGAVLF
ncbi:Ig-like domain-containing protein, partial [Caulobacter hibisci]